MVKRKKLPWLVDNGAQIRAAPHRPRMPGAFESKEGTEMETLPSAQSELPVLPAHEEAGAPATINQPETSHAPATTAPNRSEAPVIKRASITSLEKDLSVRPIGSMQSLNQHEKPLSPPRSMSLTSEPRPGMKPVPSRQDARRAFAITKGKPAKGDDYTPSEYSTTISSSDVEHAPSATPDTPPRHASVPTVVKPIPKRKPEVSLAQYQRQVRKAVARKELASTKEPHWLQSQLDLPLNEVAPEAFKRKCSNETSDCECGKSPVLEREKQKAETRMNLTQRPASVPSAPRQAPPIQYKEPTDVVAPFPMFPPPRRSIPLVEAAKMGAAMPTATGSDGPVSLNGRTPTLPNLPPHLVESSSHSTDVPSHLVTSDEYSSSPRNVSPRNTVKEATVVLSPTPPPAATAGKDLRREVRKVGHLMDQALGAVDDATKRGRPDDVKRILEGASSTLKSASTTGLYNSKRAGRESGPLQLSPSESSLSEDSGVSELDNMAGSGL